MSLRSLTIPAQAEPPEYLLVALHGWGANADDLASLAPYMQLPNVQMIFPDGPFPHPYAPGGCMWYNLPSDYSFFSKEEFRQQPELVESRKLLTELLLSLEATTGVPLSRTILAGFSQGGAMTLDVGLNLPLKALLVLSGYLHAPPVMEQATPPEVLIIHGRQDQVVPIAAAHRSRDVLTKLGATVNYHELNMGHEIQFTVLTIMQSFIGERALSLGGTTRNNIG